MMLDASQFTSPDEIGRPSKFASAASTVNSHTHLHMLMLCVIIATAI